MYEPKIRQKQPSRTSEQGRPRTLLRKVNNFAGERLQIACDTIIDISNAVAESVEPIEKHRPGLVPKFVEGQKQLFSKRMNARARLLGQGR